MMAQSFRHSDAGDVPLQGLLGWLTLVFVLAVAIPYGGVEPTSWFFFALLAIPLLAVQNLIDLRFGPGSAGRALWPWLLMMVGVFGWVVIQTMPGIAPRLAHPAWSLVPDAVPRISADPIAGYHGLSRYLLYFSVFWIMMRASRRPDRAMLFLKTIALCTSALALFGLGAAAMGTNPLLENQGGTVRASFVNRNSYATYAVFGLVTNLAVYLHTVKSDREDTALALRNFLEAFFSRGWLYFLGALFCAAALLGTQSRAGVLSGLIALIVLFWLHFRAKDADLRFGLPAVILVVGFAGFFLSAGVVARLMGTDDESLRFIIYPHVVEAILERPLLGHGLGSFHDVFRQYVPLEASRGEWHLAHSSYLENLFELGIPAASLFFLALTGITLSMLRGNLQRRRHRTFSNIALACIAGSGFHSLFDFSLQIPAVTLLFVTLCAIGWAHCRSQR